MTSESSQVREKKAGTLVRVLAVVSSHEGRAGEIAAQFAKQGELVETAWYASSERLVTDTAASRFEAVILFPSTDTTGDTDEAALRGALPGTPVYRVS